jgi:leucyl/phenylalanyl-tRNA--protein transferase
MIPWLTADAPFPPVARALAEPNGLLAAGGELSVQRLLDAYRRGIFPWYSDGQPVLWWSPDPRMVLVPSEFVLARSLRKRLRREDYEVRVDSVFTRVMRECAAPRDDHDGTWITPQMLNAYTKLHKRGYAHSVETWMRGELVGGLYGVTIGRMFFGESMFSRVSDASKIALAYLVRQLERWDFELVDCQMATEHLASLGAREIPRGEFIRHVTKLVNYPATYGPWLFDDDLFD